MLPGWASLPNGKTDLGWAVWLMARGPRLEKSAPAFEIFSVATSKHCPPILDRVPAWLWLWLPKVIVKICQILEGLGYRLPLLYQYAPINFWLQDLKGEWKSWLSHSSPRGRLDKGQIQVSLREIIFCDQIYQQCDSPCHMSSPQVHPLCQVHTNVLWTRCSFTGILV